MKKIKKILRIVFNRRALIILILLFQLGVFFLSIIGLSKNYAWVYVAFTLLSVVVVCVILNKRTNPAYKLAWIVPTLLMPVFGGIVYLIYSTQTSLKLFKKLTVKRLKDTERYLEQDNDILSEIDDVYTRNLVKYMNHKGVYPIYKNTSVKYFGLGEEMIDALKEELKKAEHFIFMEYFIISRGRVWDEILEILKQKASEGVDVRVLYDGMVTQLNDKVLHANNIKCKAFNRFTPFVSSVQNNRDHRKIAVIDGHTAFNGGINLADEYANIISRFGHWKDTAVMLRGDAVWSFTVMFLQMWEIIAADEDYRELYGPEKYGVSEIESDGFVMPYGDAPTDGENIGELVYLDIINKARDYVYITTPYLILDNEMITALGFAAKSGVDVRIIVPGIPDKWYCYCIAQSYYKDLLDVGVKVYEYASGFIHAKNFVSDDSKAVVGTINLDYRSLFLHFECATFMYGSSAVGEIKEDFFKTLESCREIDYEYIKNIPFLKKVVNGILRTLGPLL